MLVFPPGLFFASLAKKEGDESKRKPQAPTVHRAASMNKHLQERESLHGSWSGQGASLVRGPCRDVARMGCCGGVRHLGLRRGWTVGFILQVLQSGF